MRFLLMSVVMGGYCLVLALPASAKFFTPPADSPAPRRTASGAARFRDIPQLPTKRTWQEEQRRREDATKYKPLICSIEE
jgi:hypothetical protein